MTTVPPFGIRIGPLDITGYGIMLMVGFGIKTATDAARVAAVADGAVVGSAIVDRIAKAPPGTAAETVGAFVRELAAAMRAPRP